jgi:hypothetical protein
LKPRQMKSEADIRFSRISHWKHWLFLLPHIWNPNHQNIREKISVFKISLSRIKYFWQKFEKLGILSHCQSLDVPVYRKISSSLFRNDLIFKPIPMQLKKHTISNPGNSSSTCRSTGSDLSLKKKITLNIFIK